MKLLYFLTSDVSQSQRLFQLDEKVEVQLTAFKTNVPMRPLFKQIKGAGYRKPRYRGVWEKWYGDEVKKKQGCLIKILNHDDRCGPKAMVVGAYFAWSRLGDKTMLNRYRNIMSSMKNPRLGHLDRIVGRWLTRANMQDHTGQWTLEDLIELEKANLQPEARLKVISKDWVDSCVYEGPILPNQLIIHLYHHDEHFSVIKRMAAFYGKNYYCEKCNKCVQSKWKHPCSTSCRFCGNDVPCKYEGSWIECDMCRRFFPNETCLAQHLVGDPSPCSTVKRCLECNLYYDPKENHCCWIRCCPRCDVKYNERTEGVHYCFMTRVLEKKPPVKRTHSRAPAGPAAKVRRRYRFQNYPDNMWDLTEEELGDEMRRLEEESMAVDYDPQTSYIFFDLECQQHNQIGENGLGPIFEHKPNLIIAQKCCTRCKDSDEPTCPNCNEKNKKFKTMESFCDWLFSMENKGSTAIAHNAKGIIPVRKYDLKQIYARNCQTFLAYDSQFLLQYIHQQGILPKVIPRGLSLLCIEADGIRIIDSYSFLPMALSKLPSAFNLTELKKGYFPHLFNRPENMNYKGPLPEARFYIPDQMTSKAREKFYSWYNANKDTTFNMKKELVAYCKSDVDILRRACMAFRDLFRKETGTDPFNKITIASACMNVYRRNFLRSNEVIGLVPPQGYSKNDVQSRIATIWMMWLSQQRGKEIKHSRNGGEVKVGRMKLDGICRCCFDHGFEFLGCLWHGCPRCYPNRDHKLPGSAQTVEMVYQMWLLREQNLRGHLSHLTYIWECDFRHQVAHDPALAEFYKNCPVAGPMSPREGLYGGRTNAVTLYHKCKPGEEIHYIDVVSLYPYVMKHGVYPLRHPEIYKTELDTYTYEEFARMTKLPKPCLLAGIWKIKILPPKNLFHAVLPYRSRGKLTFTLCRTCADHRQMEECQHDDEERAITGAWTHLEILKALELGYTWIKSYESWIYDKVEKLGVRCSSALFSEYINRFLKLKMEASGWPKDVKTDEEKDRYIKLVKEKEGITLEKKNIAFNPGLRQVAKLMLNSFWGKFAQRNDNPNTIYLKTEEEFYNHLTNPNLEIHSVVEISEHLFQLTVKNLDDYLEGHAASNPVIASFVTSQARLHLYSYLEKLQERVLYFDTDSIIYLTRPGEEKIETGSFLGEMTNELEEFGPGAHIQEFVSAGPKNYAFKTINDAGESQTVTKIRGFSLAYSAAQDLNFDSLCRMVQAFVENGGQEEVTIEFPQIKRNKQANVTTATSKKTYKVAYDKRRILEGSYQTLPFGYSI